MEELNVLAKPIGREMIDVFGWLRASRVATGIELW